MKGSDRVQSGDAREREKSRRGVGHTGELPERALLFGEMLSAGLGEEVRRRSDGGSHTEKGSAIVRPRIRTDYKLASTSPAKGEERHGSTVQDRKPDARDWLL